ncbi:choice-of-anchor D domain-containing protein [Dokdonia sinensis]|uniref:Choice-of-anchor D domain-containing protein n=1 Tax=Dokdonia sinensis TaxID=2479847 RepID=A0A3M0GQ75_9FLAO|nr:LamG-like jellyroll fold domain-containing protein [Dokdonia sinensis]RMB63853.1 choice-of-anchor D domain-containing protein [Dokdonia sinensis]
MKTTLLKDVLRLVGLLSALFFVFGNTIAQTTLFNADFANGGGDNAWSSSTNVGSTWERVGASQNVRINPRNVYDNSSFSDYISRTIDFTGYGDLVLDVDLYCDTEFGYDGMRIEYSIAGGAWTPLGTQASGFYNDTGVDAIGFGADGWSGNQGDFSKSIDLSAFDASFDNESDVRFRFLFASDGSIQGNDVRFDNFRITGDTYVPSYCTSGGFINPSVIRRVAINTIDNNTPIENIGYSDFTNLSTNLQQGSTHNLIAQVNTNGNNYFEIKAWIDWNQDYDFDDAGEEYNLGTATNVTNGATSNSPLSITVPLGATLGNTRMRVVSYWNGTPTSCSTNFYGETEDYTINVTNNIPAPEIEITGNGNSINDGDTGVSTANATNFGGTAVGATIDRVFTITNAGNLNLTISSATLTGGDAARFNFITSPATTIAPGTSSTFTIRYTPTVLGTDGTTVRILSNDSDEAIFTYAIQGSGIDPTAIVDVYCEDFETGSHSWSVTDNTNGDFSRGTEGTASSGADGGYFYSDRVSGGYSNNSSLVIESPTLDFTGYERLVFNADIWYDFSNDGDPVNPTPDGFQIQFSDNDGVTWYALGAKDEGSNWYNSDVVYNFGNIVGGTFTYINGWTGNSGGWVNVSIDLHSQAFDNNPNVKFRVDFRSDSGTTDIGMAFDNICVTGKAIETITDPTCGPAGIGANLKLWLRADAISGVVDGNNLNIWEDQVLNDDYRNATASSGSEPSYRNNTTDNLNFHPVVKFDGLNTYMTGKDGFYSDEFYIVIKPDSAISAASSPNDIFCGDDYVNVAPSEDVTGFELGNTSARFNNDVAAFNLGTQLDYGVAEISTTKIIEGGNIFNGRTNNSNDGLELFQNGLNIGNSIANTSKFSKVQNSRYFLGRSEFFGPQYAGDIVEVISYSQSNSDIDQQKIQSYLATKYGITLGTNGTSLNYVDTDANIIWDISEDSGAFNYDIAGIGRDDCSELNQKQSKSINSDALLTFGLGDIFTTNAANTNTFPNDKDFLMWGNDNGDLTSASPIGVDLSDGIAGTSTPVDFIAINRVWKVVESGSIGSTKISIPESALTAVITPPGNFLMFISDTPNFNPTSDYRVMQLNGSNLETTFDFDGTKYITFGYAPEYRFERSVTFGGVGDYLDAGDVLDLASEFTISVWVNRGPNSGNKELIAKRNDGPWNEGYSLRLTSSGEPRMVWRDSAGTNRNFNSSVVIPQNQWHHIAVVYSGGTATFYINGVEDTSFSAPAPAPTAQHFTIGAVDSNNPTNFFDGILDEVRVWQAALSENQLRYIMNQEIIEHSDGSVNGKIVPQDITKNDIKTIPWTSLDGYFPMNLFAYTNIKDESSNGHIAAIRNLNTVSAQTAPLPYVSTSDGQWNTAGTWKNGSTLYTPGSIANPTLGTNVDWNIVQTNHEVTSQINTNLLALDVKSSKVLIENDSKIEVSHYLNLDGVLDLVGESQLVQTENSDLDPTSSGNIERDQQGTADTFTYNFWSSPVSTMNTGAINQPYTVASIMLDGSDEDNPLFINFTGGYDGSPGPPITLSNFWFFKYANQISSTYSAWQHVGSGGTMLPGEGWTMKGPGTGGVTTPQNYTFLGLPNNATNLETIALPVNGGNDYLVGNPFPSALDARDFITDNPQLDGTLYFWEHWGGGSHYLQQYQGGYAMYNLSGGIEAMSHPLVSQSGTGTKKPQRYVPVGQAFFVKAVSDGDITFSNTQRNFVKENPANSIFLDPEGGRSAPASVPEQDDDTIFDEEDTRTKFKFSLDIVEGIKRFLLLTLDENTTYGYDRGYDGEVTDLQNSDMTWLVSDRKTIIQGAPNTNDNSEFPLFLQLQDDETIIISIESEEFVNSEDIEYVFIWDKLQNSRTNLREENFTISLPAGTYNDRFSIVFRGQNDNDQTDNEETEDDSTDEESEEDESDDEETLNIQDENLTIQSFIVHYSKDNNELIINNPSQHSVESARLYNILGQQIEEWPLQSNYEKLILPLPNVSKGTYILSFGDQQYVVTAKVIIY